MALKRLREKLATCVKEKQDYLEGWQRARADFSNFKREENQRDVEHEERIKAELAEAIIPTRHRGRAVEGKRLTALVAKNAARLPAANDSRSCHEKREAVFCLLQARRCSVRRGQRCCGRCCGRRGRRCCCCGCCRRDRRFCCRCGPDAAAAAAAGRSSVAAAQRSSAHRQCVLEEAIGGPRAAAVACSSCQPGPSGCWARA